MFREIYLNQILMIAAGLGLFLHGLAYGSRALREGLGDGARRFFMHLGNRRGLSFIFGMLLSLLTQSSTAATSMAVGLVDVGLLPLTGAVVVMVGASVGTTLVILVLSLDVVRFSPLLLLTAVLLGRVRNRTWRQPAHVLMGFSLVLVGMLLLNQGVRFLSDSPELNRLLLATANSPFLVALLSFGLTSLIQSNVPVLALTIALATVGTLPLSTALPIVVGAHIGSSTTVLISGFGARINARTLARASLFYKLGGTMLVIPLSGMILAGAKRLGGSPGQNVAWMQILVTGINALALLPLTGPLTSLSRRVSRNNLPGTDVSEPLYLDMGAAPFAPLALSLLSREMIRLAGFLQELVFSCLRCENQEDPHPMKLAEDLTELGRSCLNYLLLIPAPAAGSALSREYASLSYAMAALRDLVRIASRRMAPFYDTRERCWCHGNGEWRALTESLKELMRESLGSLAIGGSDLACRAGEQYHRYLEAENCVRGHLLSRSAPDSSKTVQEAWDFLSATGGLARACLELAHSESLSRREGKEQEEPTAEESR